MRERINAALKAAMKAQEPCRTSTLRLMAAALKDREIAARDEEGIDPPDDEAAALSILSKMIRQREESVRTYEEAGRLELADREREEIAVIREFMPKPMTQEEIDGAIAAAIADTGAEGLKDMGRVMAALKAEHPGRMDFGKVGRQVKGALAG
jgi:uncharacterized protein YqeY